MFIFLRTKYNLIDSNLPYTCLIPFLAATFKIKFTNVITIHFKLTPRNRLRSAEAVYGGKIQMRLDK